MNLTILVYVIETLTYNNNFFATIAAWLAVCLIAFVCTNIFKRYYDNVNKGSSEEITFKGHLEEGSIFTLTKDFKRLKANTPYEVSSLYRSLDCKSIYVYNLEGRSVIMDGATIDEVEELLKTGGTIKCVTEGKTLDIPKLPIKLVSTLLVVSLFLHTFLPSRQTAIYMAGAYAIEKVVTSDKTQQLGNYAFKATINQLDIWAKEVPELKQLITDEVRSGVNSVKETLPNTEQVKQGITQVKEVVETIKE